MIPQEEIYNLKQHIDVLKVCEALGIELRKHGSRYAACCPLHNEKTPSFFVTPQNGRWHCFGCGEGGDAIALVMEMRKAGYVEALRWVASVHGVELTEAKETPEQKRVRLKRHSLMEVNALAAEYWHQRLVGADCGGEPPVLPVAGGEVCGPEGSCPPAGGAAMGYALGRWSRETIEKWMIGYAPDDFAGLWEWLTVRKRVAPEAVDESGLVFKNAEGRRYLFFRERLMFPIMNAAGEVVGFSGRALTEEAAGRWGKYKNTAENPDDEARLYRKSEVLFGWNFARVAAQELKEAVLVEGNPDVIHMHELGITNVTASCGTAISEAQARMIAERTRNVTLMYDRDEAGEKATERNGEMLMRQGLNVYVLRLPGNWQTEGKTDPDSFFKTGEQYRQLRDEARVTFTEWYARRHEGEADDPAGRSELMHHVVGMLQGRSSDEQLNHINLLTRIVAGKQQWMEVLKEERRKWERKQTGHEVDEQGLTQEERQMAEEYGIFYRKGGMYMMTDGGGYYQFANFVMKPLFLMRSETEVKRMFTVTNQTGESYDIEVQQKTLTSPADFETRMAELGNFWYDGSKPALTKLKRYLYAKSLNCREIKQLGWQAEGFWAWGNGIATEKGFRQADEAGIVEMGGRYYYLPSMNMINQQVRTAYAFEKRFVYTGGEADLTVLAGMMREVYGDNGLVGVCYYLATLLRSTIFERFNSFPLLNIFGQKGTGKTEMAITMMQLFGRHGATFNLTNATKAAVSEHLSLTANAYVHLDEYKNSLEYEKIEVLKGAYDGMGRNRLNKEKGFRNEPTMVDCGVILTGQEMTTADNALFSRVLFLQFTRTSFTAEQTAAYERLKRYEKGGLTAITERLVTLAEGASADFEGASQAAMAELAERLGGRRMERRIEENWGMLLGAVKAWGERVQLPWTWEETVRVAAELAGQQNDGVQSANELSEFWHAVESLLVSGDVELGYDLVLKAGSVGVKAWKGCGGTRREVEYTMTRDVLYVNPSRLFNAYFRLLKSVKSNQRAVIDEASLRRYLTSQEEYMGDQTRSFKVPTRNMQNPSGSVVYGEDGQRRYEPYKSARALVFDYGMLKELYGIDLDVRVEAARMN